MNFNEQIYNDLLTALTEWKPKNTPNNISGIGFNEHNVVDYESTLPTGNPFDFVYLGFPSKIETPLTTGSTHIKRSIQTFTVEMYCKREGTGISMKKATKRACEENSDFISNFFASLGFTVNMPIPNLNHSGNGIARQPMYFTRTFVDN